MIESAPVKPIYETIYCQTRWLGSHGEHILIYDVLAVCWFYVFFDKFTGKVYRCNDYYRAMVAFGKIDDNIIGFMREMRAEYDAQHEPEVRRLRGRMRLMWPKIEAMYLTLYGFDLDGNWNDYGPPEKGAPRAPGHPVKLVDTTTPFIVALSLAHRPRPRGPKKNQRAPKSQARGARKSPTPNNLETVPGQNWTVWGIKTAKKNRRDNLKGICM
ncbi:hypothetical protein CPLU01_02615 [Colletotrichum plurivorum]|uniref:Uncharacterized protein n=1 Tax=Colletotrichum plurivorum TaxID=2175906 RepID=A0A8H6KV54_9PEZI|nr:hypothetical protein CPLU01_02615 [Colletotrichum plurivorum]